MKLTKRELIEHLDKYPDDYKLDLSHYFLVDASGEGDKPVYYQAIYEMPILGTAADEENKLIRFITANSHMKAIERISGGLDPIEDPHVTKIAARKTAAEPANDTDPEVDEKQTAAK